MSSSRSTGSRPKWWPEPLRPQQPARALQAFTGDGSARHASRPHGRAPRIGVPAPVRHRPCSRSVAAISVTGRAHSEHSASRQPRRNGMRGAGRATFAAILLLIAGTLNIIYGIGALDSANIFANDTRYIFTDLNTLGWALIVLAVIQLTGGFSLLAGNTYGRVIGIIGGSLGAIGALLSIGGNYPWWSLGIFALCVYIVHGIVVYGEDVKEERAITR